LLIGNDIDPTTSLPYAPSSVLQAALWTAEELRSRILSQGDLSTSAEDSIDLGLTQSSSDIIATSSRHRRGTPRSRVASPTSGSFPAELSVSSSLSPFPIPPCKVYYPIPTDDTQGLGAGGLLSKLTQLQDMPNIPDLGPDNTASLPDAASASRSRPPPHSETTAFGLLTGARSLLDLSDNLGESRWSKIPPFRFSVEFWNLDKLLEKERAYSDTHFYAGSWFNVYVQLIRKKDKGTQLGIYLHRQSPAEPFPIPSTPWRKVEKVGSTPPMGLTRAISSPVVGVGSPPISARSEESPAGKEEEGPYRDPRRITKVRRPLSRPKGVCLKIVWQAYFSISCASALGTAVIRFISAPDNFTISQSWGWKSSALRSEEYLGGGGGSGSGSSGAESLEDGVLGWVGDVGEGRGREGREGREGSLRATVVVGVI